MRFYYIIVVFFSLITLSACTSSQSPQGWDIATEGLQQNTIDPLVWTQSSVSPELTTSRDIISQSTVSLLEDEPELKTAYNQLHPHIERISAILWINYSDTIGVSKKYKKELTQYSELLSNTSINKTLSGSSYVLSWDRKILALIDGYEIFFTKNFSKYNPNIWVWELRISVLEGGIVDLISQLAVVDSYLLPDGTIVQKDMSDAYRQFVNERWYLDNPESLEEFKMLAYQSEMIQQWGCEGMTDWPDKENCKLLNNQ